MTYLYPPESNVLVLPETPVGIIRSRHVASQENALRDLINGVEELMGHFNQHDIRNLKSFLSLKGVNQTSYISLLQPQE